MLSSPAALHWDGGETQIESINPHTGEFLASHSLLEPSGAEKLLSEAAGEWPSFAAKSPSERGDSLMRLAGLLRENSLLLSLLMVAEVGKPFKQAQGEVEKCAGTLEWFAREAPNLLLPQVRPGRTGEVEVELRAQGLILAIMPWNFPLWQVIRCAAPAWMLGNGLLIKHAPGTMGCSKELVRLAREAGLGPGAVQDMPLPLTAIPAMVADPRVRAVTLTGSGRAGRAVAELAGRHVKKCVLELGGSDAFVVMADADLEACVQAAISARLLNNGQSCIAAKRFFVEQSIYADFVEAFAAGLRAVSPSDPRSTSCQLGPMHRADLRNQLLHQFGESVRQGGRIAVAAEAIGGAGFYLRPGLITHAPPESPAAREELFGPVASVWSFLLPEELAQQINASPYGLAASVWGEDLEAAAAIGSQLDVGAVFLNEAPYSDAGVPFGGTKESGFGRELGYEGLAEFANIRTFHRRPLARKGGA